MRHVPRDSQSSPERDKSAKLSHEKERVVANQLAGKVARGWATRWPVEALRVVAQVASVGDVWVFEDLPGMTESERAQLYTQMPVGEARLMCR